MALTLKAIKDLLDELHLDYGTIWDEILPEIQAVLVRSGVQGIGGVREALSSVVALEPDAFKDVLPHVTEWATARAAELVGRRIDQETGAIIDNPDPEWSISNTMRERLNSYLTEAVTEGKTLPEMRADLMESYDFSQDRANMIARTEVNMALVRGQLDAAVAAEVEEKTWDAAPECCEECDDLDGVTVGIGEDFPDAGEGPPLHPHCRCGLKFTMQASASDLAAMAKYSEDQPRDDHGRWSGGGGVGFAEVPAKDFIAARDASTRSMFLTANTAEDLKGSTLYLSADGKTGYALDAHGDLQNVFNNGGPKGQGQAAIVHAVQSGAKTLDCFDGFLPEMYAPYGFVATGRMAFNDEFKPSGWNTAAQGRPDVVFMAYQGGARDTLSERVRSFPAYKPSDGPHYASWEDAKSDSRGAVRDGADDHAKGGGLRPGSVGDLGGTAPLGVVDVAKYSDSQPRDEQGRWTSSGSRAKKSAITKVPRRIFEGRTVSTRTRLTKEETGAIGERIAKEYFSVTRGQVVQSVNVGMNNAPVDLVAKHEVIEVKAGLVSNSYAAMKWRITLGKPEVTEREAMKKMSPARLKEWNAHKMDRAYARKEAFLKDWSKQKGVKMTARTAAVIIHPDKKSADLHIFPGFHRVIRWNSAIVKEHYVGTFKYQ